MIFQDRQEAGRKLAEKLLNYKQKPNTLVLGLPRGGVVTAAEVADELGLPLDIIVPRKIGAPDNPELAIGAVTEDGGHIQRDDIVSMFGVQKTYIEEEVKKEREEAKRRLNTYRGGLPERELSGKIVILVDDGIATGMTMRAAVLSAKRHRTERIIVAAPVGAQDSVEQLQAEADEVVVLDAPPDFAAVGQFYREFDQTSDEEVIKLLHG